eukprot:TRINITY_DN1385_c0_g1_i1.p1 TRINITY_DN1385_c0_g1~~TRINITY_DN1385_c0_g1_i1.p1  ORF type:complete len:225 (+),score=32.60 TRINITY_DN1385_c0_g1_i1:42-716(+)
MGRVADVDDANSPDVCESVLSGVGGHVLWLDAKPSAVVGGVVIPPNFAWVDEGRRLAASGYPRRGVEVEGLVGMGIRHIVSVHERGLSDEEEVTWPAVGLVFGMKQPAGLLARGKGVLKAHHIPCADGSCPTPAQLDTILSIVVTAASRNEGVLLHCQSGVGRAGTASALCLTALQKIHPDDAIAALYDIPRPIYKFNLSMKQLKGLADYFRDKRDQEEDEEGW